MCAFYLIRHIYQLIYKMKYFADLDFAKMGTNACCFKQ